MIVDSRFVIAVPDLERSAAFYRDILGFEIREIGDQGWRMYVRDGCSILAGECPDAIPAAELGDHSYFAYFIVEDVDAEFARVQAEGAQIIKPLRSEPWRMREFGLRTVDGHRIMIAQRLEASY